MLGKTAKKEGTGRKYSDNYEANVDKLIRIKSMAEKKEEYEKMQELISSKITKASEKMPLWKLKQLRYAADQKAQSWEGTKEGIPFNLMRNALDEEIEKRAGK